MPQEQDSESPKDFVYRILGHRKQKPAGSLQSHSRGSLITFSIQEFLFLPPRGMIRVPEDFEAFRGYDFSAFLDQGYQRRHYRHWTFWKLIKPEWYQSYRNWSLCREAPRYCIVALDNLTAPNDRQIALEVGGDVEGITIWIPDRAILRIFLQAFPFQLFPKSEEDYENFEAVENLLNLCFTYAHDPSPGDYLRRFWPSVRARERQEFLVDLSAELTERERKWFWDFIGPGPRGWSEE